ncbi:MAG: hypothetical protein R2873_18450 [Caldilineaceae bacterium]
MLPLLTGPSLLLQRIRRQMAAQKAPRSQIEDQTQRCHLYRQGRTIHVDADLVMWIETGVVAQTVIHADGSEVMLGLYGPGLIVIPHPEDGCFIHLTAHTDVQIELMPWAQAITLPDFAERLRLRLRLMEAWSANQARFPIWRIVSWGW